MSHILAFCLLLSLSSCEFLLSPPAVAFEEELALEAIKIIEKELESKPAP